MEETQEGSPKPDYTTKVSEEVQAEIETLYYELVKLGARATKLGVDYSWFFASSHFQQASPLFVITRIFMLADQACQLESGDDTNSAARRVMWEQILQRLTAMLNNRPISTIDAIDVHYGINEGQKKERSALNALLEGLLKEPPKEDGGAGAHVAKPGG